MKINFLAGFIVLIIISGFSYLYSLPFDEDRVPKKYPGITNTGKVYSISSGSPVNISINTDTIRFINPGLYGNNAAIWDGDAGLLNNTMKERMKKVNISILRFPGGSSSDHYHWDNNYPSYAISQGWNVFGGLNANNWAVDTYEFLTMCEELGIPDKMFTANHGFCYYDNAYDGPKASYISNAAQLAADWVEYCNAPNDGSNPNGGIDWAAQRAADGHLEPFNVKYWEVGNEVFGSWEVGYETDGAEYGKHFKAFYDAMKTVDTNIYIGMVINPDDWNWSRDALSYPGVASRVDYLIPHSYFLWVADPWDKSSEEVLASYTMLDNIYNTINSLIQNYTVRTDIAIAMTEYNTCLPANHHTIELTGGLFITKAIGRMMELGYHAALLWDVQNAYNSSDGGDHAFTFLFLYKKFW